MRAFSAGVRQIFPPVFGSALFALGTALGGAACGPSETGEPGDGNGNDDGNGSGGDNGGGGSTSGDTTGGASNGDPDNPRGSGGPPPIVTLFEACNQDGAQATLSVGDYDSAALAERGLTPGSIGALRVTTGYKAILYDHDAFLGASLTLNGGEQCLTTDFPTLASLRIREDLGTDGGGTGGTWPPCTTASPETETCEPFGVLLAGKYWVNNNLWGQGSGTGTQCVRRTCSDTNAITWETDWTWSMNQNQVKSFASAVLGWHWGSHVQGTGLPIQISAGNDVNCDWSYTVGGSGTMNVAYDLWLHSIPNPDSTNNGANRPTDELMIWLYRDGGAGPLGANQGNVQIAGAEWALHHGAIVEDGQTLWEVHSFVRTQNTLSASLNLKAFIDEVVSRGWIPSNHYLTSIQAGTEVFTGSGSLQTTSFDCNIP